MILKSSPKIFQNYKSNHPAKTISAVKKSFKKLGLNLNNLKYRGEKVGDIFSIYGGEITYGGEYVCAGKGLSLQLSEASAYAEAAERIPPNMSPLSAHINRKLDIEGAWMKGYSKGTQDKIKNALGVEEFFKGFPNIDIREIREGELAKHWVDAYSLTEDKRIKVPPPLVREISGSNGCAAGNTMEEAIHQGFAEVCERYSLIRYITENLFAPTVNKKTIKNKEIKNLIELFDSLNISVEIKDLTMGNKVPVMGVVFTNHNLDYDKDSLRYRLFHRTLHAGSHLDLNQAIIRCFIEEWQTSTNTQALMYHREMNIIDRYFDEKRKKEIVDNFNKDFNPLMVFNRSFSDFDFIDRNAPIISFGDLVSHETDDFYDDVKIISNLSQKNGWKPLIMDYSIPEIPLSVIRMVIPTVSDTLRYNHPDKKEEIKIPYDKKLVPSLKSFSAHNKIKTKEIISAAENPSVFKSFLAKKNINVKEIVPLLEKELIEHMVTPYPPYRTLEYNPPELLKILRSGLMIMGNKQKSSKTEALLEDYPA